MSLTEMLDRFDPALYRHGHDVPARHGQDGLRMTPILPPAVLWWRPMPAATMSSATAWSLRESPYGYHQHFPDILGFDGAVPRSGMGGAVAAIRAAMAERLGLSGSGLVRSGPPRPPYLYAPDGHWEGGRETGRRWESLRREFR